MKKLLFIIVIYVGMCPLLSGKGANMAFAEGGKFTVVIDAGHGGKDEGASGLLSKEKNIALAIALKAGNYIAENLPDVNVVYTRTTDVFVPLHERAGIANKTNAQLFISIHVNSSENTKASGTSSHVLGLHRAGENFEVAKRENSVILLEDDHSTRYQNFDPNKPESYIIFSVLQNIFLQQSIEMAAQVQDQFRDRAGRKDRGVVQQGLLVLAQTSMPGLLIETGFISNPEEEKYLMSESGQNYIASAIFRAFREYKNLIESKSDFKFAENTSSPQSNNTAPVGQAVQYKANGTTNGQVSDGEVAKKTIDSAQITDEIIYRVQVSASFSKLDPRSPFFKGLQDIEILETDGVFKYVMGSSTSYATIKKVCDEVRKLFPDAFIIALKQGKIISLQQALLEDSLKNKNIN